MFSKELFPGHASLSTSCIYFNIKMLSTQEGLSHVVWSCDLSQVVFGLGPEMKCLIK